MGTFFPSFPFLLLLLLCLTSFSFGATLQQDEVEALKDIGNTLGKKDWDFSVDPCSGQSNWKSVNQSKGSENSVTCNCSFANNTACHVISIVLKSQNLSGTLPPELVRLPYLQEIDLTLNYLNGTIPIQWGTLNLVNISFLGNRVTGPIPKELGNITTLKSLVLEFNQLYGDLPPELGNLTQIERLLLTSNNFTGEIPATFAKLTTLKHVRIGDNQFSGAIPNFIQSWINLEILVIQGSGFSGPIPSGISLLKNLTDLRITDLNGSDSPFPQLNNMTNLETLILRSCNITGALPEHLGNLISLQLLDLSYNKLSGQIPSSFDSLQNMNMLFLAGNNLTGPLPHWIDKPDFVDLSYNNFSIGNIEQQTCQQGSANFFSSSSNGNSLGNVSCLANVQCPKTMYSLYINCGGKLITSNGSKSYDDDSSDMGAARFRQTGTNWAVMTGGHFLDSGRSDYYKWSNTTKLAMDNAELYMDARVSPNSLTYYGFCMGNGNYTVNLHFAEIMFTDDKTYSSLGRRVFDIYIQRKLVVKDFNIAEEAGGFDKAVIKKFTAAVTSNALEIRLYWAGKGTSSIPFRSVYGPLISAISVHSDFTPPSENSTSISARAVVAIVAAGVIIIILVFGILWWKGCLGQKRSVERALEGLDSNNGLFSLRQIKAATNNFDRAFKIGEGGFGPVYKGILSDGRIVAVKQLSAKSRQGNREFINEIGLISALQHPCLVKLHGFCMEEDQLLLIYEYMENNSLARALFVRNDDPEKSPLRLDWETRQRICVGIAKGLAYLHEESRLKIVHRDIKATNVLLDKDLNPKISDFGLAKLNEEDNTHISTRIAGTYGYMAPEYAMHGYLTDKADVYSFGIVALEIVSGMSNTISQLTQECFSFLDWVHVLKEKGNLMELVDKRLGGEFNKEEAMLIIKVSLLCTNFSPTLRPAMSSVVNMLEGRSVVHEVSDTSEALDDEKFEKMKQYYQ
ncbi:PREDICTED: probable leucine-rich repeat receptor-like serine/threonine-protein kinase At3g14840 isoform X2 [Lupinus angustifolius]|uniref:probable leucine-rich repeat receptor-like serine/threonine-protein kinase At3g14840 isoform X2 n=1 Tax=Lupinus angustifolius TaxID=3871 RepID=UPI00092F50B9|nr:PREDICTED: probable leucine-rich repeat receptor-like serine/threonine-protein kinase At3g14840 isoform X2 [Lupinus angustifolius]